MWMFGKYYKEDCFAFRLHDGKLPSCNALTNMYCGSCVSCPFYKNVARRKAELKAIETKGLEKLIYG